MANVGDIVCVAFEEDQLMIGKLLEQGKETVKVMYPSGAELEITPVFIKTYSEMVDELAECTKFIREEFSDDPVFSHTLSTLVDLLSSRKTVVNLMKFVQNSLGGDLN